MKQLGRLPRRGETVTLEGFEFRVTRADRRRVETLRVTCPKGVVPIDERSQDERSHNGGS